MSPKDKFTELKKENRQLKTEAELYREKYEQATRSYDALLHHFKQLQRTQFGTVSERYTDLFNGQQALFEKAEFSDENSDDDPDPKGGISVKGYERKKKDHISNYDHLPTREEVIPVDPVDKQCNCGREKRVVGYEKKWVLHYVPAVFERIVQKREKVSCPRCKESICTALAPPQLLPKLSVTEELLAQVIINKCIDRQPLYHIEKYWKERFKVTVKRQTMANWIIESAKKMMPLMNMLKDEIIGYPISAIDATSIQVLAEEGRKPTTSSYMYCIRGGPPKKRVVMYDYNDKKHKVFVENWYTDYSGSIHSDAQDIFVALDQKDDITMSYCNAHARRYFEKITKSTPQEGLAHTAMRYFRSLYRIEAKAKAESMTPAERLALRQKKSKAIVKNFHRWLTASELKVLPKSPIGKAIRYTLKHWIGLTRFLDNGELEMDNNLTEQQIKPFVMARKNFLFSYSVDGAHALATFFSLIQSAKSHNIEPCAYLSHVFKKIPLCSTWEDYEALLPWNVAENLKLTLRNIQKYIA